MSHRATFGQPGAYLDTFTYDYRGRVEEHSRVINGRTTTMTVNQFKGWWGNGQKGQE